MAEKLGWADSGPKGYQDFSISGVDTGPRVGPCLGGKAVYLPICLLTASQKASKGKGPRRMRRRKDMITVWMPSELKPITFNSWSGNSDSKGKTSNTSLRKRMSVLYYKESVLSCAIDWSSLIWKVWHHSETMRAFQRLRIVDPTLQIIKLDNVNNILLIINYLVSYFKNKICTTEMSSMIGFKDILIHNVIVSDSMSTS